MNFKQNATSDNQYERWIDRALDQLLPHWDQSLHNDIALKHWCDLAIVAAQKDIGDLNVEIFRQTLIECLLKIFYSTDRPNMASIDFSRFQRPPTV